MEMEVRWCNFKVKLQTLITEVGELREKQRLSSDQLHNQFQKWKQDEQEFCTKITELEAELASSIQLRQQLQRKVQFLEDENCMHQSKHKQLKETIDTILQAKEAFLEAYQESTCEMKRSIEWRDRKIAFLSEKIESHLVSLDSIRKEASSVKQLVDNAQRVVAEKEGVVARLKIQMYKVCAFEKNNDFEAKLKSKEDELHRKDRVIAELQTQLETAKIAHQFLSKIEELEQAVVMKEGIIETLISENKALRSELGMLEVSFKIVQDAMDEEDMIGLADQEKDGTEKKRNRMSRDDIDKCEANYHHVADLACKEHLHIPIPIPLNVHSCVSESNFSPSRHLESQPVENASNAQHKDNCNNTCMQQLDSECSTTQAQA